MHIASQCAPLTDRPACFALGLSRSPVNGRAKGSGFTLLEMMLVLLILSMLAGLFVTARIASMMDERKDLTLTRMQTIQKQVIWFRQINHRLPCPANPALTIASTSYGKENQAGACDPSLGGYPGTINVAAGSVPSKTLRLGDEFMYDGYGRRFTYEVAQEFTKPKAFCTWPISGSGVLGLTIKDESANVLSNQMLYALISFGLNGHGAYLQSGQLFSNGNTNANVAQNCACTSTGGTSSPNGTLIDAPFTQTNTGANNGYDDILSYASREQIASQDDINGTTEVCP